MRAKCLKTTRASGQAEGKCKQQSLFITAGRDNMFWKMCIKYINAYKIEWEKERKQHLISTEHSMSGIFWWLRVHAREQRANVQRLYRPSCPWRGLGWPLPATPQTPGQVVWSLAWPAEVASWDSPMGSEDEVRTSISPQGAPWGDSHPRAMGTLANPPPVTLSSLSKNTVLPVALGSGPSSTPDLWTDRPTIQSVHEWHLRKAKSPRNTRTDPSIGPRMPADFKNCQVTSASIKMKLKNYWWCFTQIEINEKKNLKQTICVNAENEICDQELQKRAPTCDSR